MSQKEIEDRKKGGERILEILGIRGCDEPLDRIDPEQAARVASLFRQREELQK